MFESGVVRKIIVLGVLALLWEGYARWLDNPLLFPTFYDTLSALFASVESGQLVRAAYRFAVPMHIDAFVREQDPDAFEDVPVWLKQIGRAHV